MEKGFKSVLVLRRMYWLSGNHCDTQYIDTSSNHDVRHTTNITNGNGKFVNTEVTRCLPLTQSLQKCLQLSLEADEGRHSQLKRVSKAADSPCWLWKWFISSELARSVKFSVSALCKGSRSEFCCTIPALLRFFSWHCFIRSCWTYNMQCSVSSS